MTVFLYACFAKCERNPPSLLSGTVFPPPFYSSSLALLPPPRYNKVNKSPLRVGQIADLPLRRTRRPSLPSRPLGAIPVLPVYSPPSLRSRSAEGKAVGCFYSPETVGRPRRQRGMPFLSCWVWLIDTLVFPFFSPLPPPPHRFCWNFSPKTPFFLLPLINLFPLCLVHP